MKYSKKVGEAVKYCFIINPAAGKGTLVDEMREKIEGEAQKLGVEYDVFISESVESTKEYVETVASSSDGEVGFIACGGDGTLCKTILAVTALSEDKRSRVSVGVIPMGTGNDFVSNFENKDKFFDIAAQLDPTCYEIDLIKCNDVYSVNMVNVGFDSHVVCKKEKIGKKKWVPRKLAYIFALVITLVRKPWLKVDISCDGGESEHKELLLTTMANGAFCGGGFHSNPLASLFDGRIDLLTVKNVGRMKFLSLVGSYKKGTHIREELKHIVGNLKCDSIDMCFDEETPVSIDGEIIYCKEIRLFVERKALRIMLPAGVLPTADAKPFETAAV
ncbi:MAG: hypothetical protein E7642_07840 [Ruminococcaceae bacterium]|nr:hypothetical protein [Oscillospiraceae bacterium]